MGSDHIRKLQGVSEKTISQNKKHPVDKEESWLIITVENNLYDRMPVNSGNTDQKSQNKE